MIVIVRFVLRGFSQCIDKKRLPFIFPYDRFDPFGYCGRAIINGEGILMQNFLSIIPPNLFRGNAKFRNPDR